MKIERLILNNYRNYDKLDIELSPNLNIFIGKNAQGKSNILESIFVLALTKSYMNVKDQTLIKDGKDFFKLNAVLSDKDKRDDFEVVCSFHSKKLKINHFDVKKYSDYVSKMKVLIFSPYNVNFVKDGPNVRRKSINIVISQFSSNYLQLMQKYNAVLKKRNQFLKTIQFLDDYNSIYLAQLNDKFCTLAVDIVLEREKFVEDINRVISQIYYEIMGYSNLGFSYVTNVLKNGSRDDMIVSLKDKLSTMYDREKAYGATLIGPHRDDFIFYLDGKELSLYGSQGQIRAAILALKLAELLIFKDKYDDYPILLLDDIFSELDVEKRNRLVKYILDDVQTIITTTDINLIDDELVKKSRIFIVDNGMIVDDKKEGVQR